MLLSGLLADWFLPFVYNIGLAGLRASILGWVFLGGLVALERSANSSSASQTADDLEAADPDSAIPFAGGRG